MMKIKDLHCELEFEADVTYYHPARPAPHIQDHDDPRYGDSGDDEEIEYDLFLTSKGPLGETRHLVTDFFKDEQLVRYIYDQLDEDIREKARDEYYRPFYDLDLLEA